ncbi:MAG: Nif3-like dinuclear metal center hexameric protein [Oscillospiraceae bacterium]
MAAVKDVYCFLDKKAPFSSQLGFDNAGFLVGRSDRQVTRILVALDITEEVAKEAAEARAELIVSHHPVIWDGAKSVTDETVLGRKLLALITNDIAAICAHTNLDAAKGGVNDCLAAALGLTDTRLLKTYGVYQDGTPYGIEQVGILPGGPVSLVEFAAAVKEKLGSNGVRYVDAGRPVKKVAVGGGSCSGSMKDVLAAGCDTFVTADVKYDGFLDAKAMGLNLIDAGHYPTENVVCPVLASWLKEGFPEVEIVLSKCHKEVFSYL